MNQNLFFNILTFDWPKGPVNLYYSRTNQGTGQELYFTLFPNEVEQIFPGIVRNSTNKIYTSFGYAAEGFTLLPTKLQTENPDLVKRYYNDTINYYFRKKLGLIVKKGFINETQVWLKDERAGTEIFDVYHKFSLRVQIATVSRFPEIILTYDNTSKVCKQSVAELIVNISPTAFNWVLCNNRLLKWKKAQDFEDIDAADCYPVIGKSLDAPLGIESELPDRENNYPKYLGQIQSFHTQYLDTEEFRKFIPLHSSGFLPVAPARIAYTSPESNQLLFGNNQQGITPKKELTTLKPFKKSPYNNIHLFFIMHRDDLPKAKIIMERLEKGMGFFKGLQNFVGLTLHTEKGFSILFDDRENPIPQIEAELSKRHFNPEVKYIAVYVTPYNKFEKEKHKREIYYQLKELLLKRRITSQAIDPVKMQSQGQGWVYSLPNIAVAMLAKLDGIPWRLNTPVKNELIVGVGAFKHVDDGVQYIGSAFSFANNGKFNRFEYFLRDEIDILAGSIADSVKTYATVNQPPDRLIIHFYKTMSEDELQPIQSALEELDLPIPIFIITINKTVSEDLIAFDSSWPELMPLSGTFINIGKNKYLLFNNTRYNGTIHSKADGYPFPIKLKFFCTEPEQLEDMKVVQDLIDQVYQFSRMYWKSVKQQNLPVTIKYPEMVAQIAPHFIGDDIPPYGKDNLWFL